MPTEPLTTDQKAEIIAKQEFILRDLRQVLNEYPNSFFIYVHENKQVMFAGFEGNAQTTSILFTELLSNTPEYLEWFDSCVLAAKAEVKRRG